MRILCSFSLLSRSLYLSLLASASLAAQIPPIPHPFGIAKLVQSSAADVGRIANIECGTGSTGDPLAHFSTGRGGRWVVGGIALKGEWQRAIGARRPRHCESARLTLNDICLFFAELRLTTIKCSKRRSNNNNNINNNSIK